MVTLLVLTPSTLIYRCQEKKNSFIHNYDDKKDVHKFYLVMSIEYLNKYLLLQGTLQVL